MKKAVLVIMAVCMLAAMGFTSAHAGWYFCTVNRVGNGQGVDYICLTDANTTAAFTARWFVLDSANANQHLATSLTAASLGSQVQVYFPVAGVPPAYSTITSCYLSQ